MQQISATHLILPPFYDRATADRCDASAFVAVIQGEASGGLPVLPVLLSLFDVAKILRGEDAYQSQSRRQTTYIDRKIGKEKQVKVFAAILGASGLTYAEGSASQEKEEWIRSNERAF